jgi:hypothetical protein
MCMANTAFSPEKRGSMLLSHELDGQVGERLLATLAITAHSSHDEDPETAAMPNARPLLGDKLCCACREIIHRAYDFDASLFFQFL